MLIKLYIYAIPISEDFSMDQSCKIAALYIATLKTIALIHQQNHWTTKGDSFYGDHLLFERIYNSALENLDLAAEKFMGLLGPDCLDYTLQAELLHKVLLKYKGLEGEPLSMSLSIEKDFLKLSQQAYDSFKEDEGKLTLGLDDMLMAIASKREEAVYLLQQPLRGHHE
jgi:DNA-binding ferritin-like protein